jgi:hypothetical protein
MKLHQNRFHHHWLRNSLTFFEATLEMATYN